MKEEEKLIEKAKNHIAIAVEYLSEISKESEVYEESNVDSCIRELQDIQIIRL